MSGKKEKEIFGSEKPVAATVAEPAADKAPEPEKAPEKEPEKEPEKAPANSVEYVFRSDVKHNGKFYKKGSSPKGFSADVLKAWISNGVLLSSEAYAEQESRKKKTLRAN